MKQHPSQRHFERNLTIGFIATIVLTGLIAAAALLTLHAVIRDKDRVTYIHAEHMILVEGMGSAAERMSSSVRAYLLTGDPLYRNAYWNARSHFLALAGTLRPTLILDESRRRLADINATEETLNQRSVSIMRRRAAGETAIQINGDFERLIGPVEQRLTSQLSAMEDLKRSILEESKALAVNRTDSAINRLLAISIIAILLGVGLTLLVRRVANRLRAADDALRTSNKKLSATLESITDAFFSLDHEWRITYFNPAAAVWEGPGVAESRLGKVIWETLPDLLGSRFYTEFHKAVDTRQAVHFEEYYEPLKRWVEIHAYPSEFGLSVYFRDITERKLAEEKVRMSVQIRDEFFSIASHELKTPLSALDMQFQLLQKFIEQATPDPKQLRRGMELCREQIRRLGTLTDELLDVTRIRAGRLELNPEMFDLSELARQLVAAHTGNDTAHPLVTVHASEPVRGTWDKTRLEQVLANLLSNAVKYGQGRPIDVFVKLRRQDGDERAILQVQDQGPGIPVDLQKIIFERFERGVRGQKIRGLGLGLYITRQIVEAHGGKIWVESEPGKGALFTVEIPLKAADQRRPAA